MNELKDPNEVTIKTVASGGTYVEKRKRNQPHYKQLFEESDNKLRFLEWKIGILWRVLIGLLVIAVACGALAIYLTITQMKP
jgi:hypothetical protein